LITSTDLSNWNYNQLLLTEVIFITL